MRLEDLNATIRIVCHLRYRSFGSRGFRVADLEDLGCALALLEKGDARNRFLQDLGLKLPSPGFWKQAEALRPDKLPPVIASPQLKQLLENSFSNKTATKPDRNEMRQRLEEALSSHPGEQELDRERSRKLLSVYLEAFKMGLGHHHAGSKISIDFSRDALTGPFDTALKKHTEARRHLLLEAVNWQPASPWGWIDGCIRRNGPVATEALVLLRLNEYWPFTPKAPYLTMREIAWTLKPDYFPAIVDDLRKSMDQLSTLSLISLHPPSDPPPSSQLDYAVWLREGCR